MDFHKAEWSIVVSWVTRLILICTCALNVIRRSYRVGCASSFCVGLHSPCSEEPEINMPCKWRCIPPPAHVH
ncbi:hypothetical protein B0J14DRAFT_598352, partial [Halenospora varia]